MAEQSLYVPHCLGTLIGSRQARAWLARHARTAIEQTATPPWRGQPVFRSAADAFAWLDWARRQAWLPDGLAVACLDVPTELTAEGVHRLYVGPSRLRSAEHQILRAHPSAAGPDPQVLAACHGIARADAMRAWLRAPVGATARDQRQATLAAVWAYGYQLAGRDGHTALGGHLARAVQQLLADPGTTATGGPAVAELRRIDQATATAAIDATVTGPAAATVQETDLPADVLDKATSAERAAGHQHGWDAALAVTWQEALRLGALHGVLGAATDVYALWRTDPDAGSRTAPIEGRPADQWVKDQLRETTRAVCAQWLLAAATPMPTPRPQPDAAAPPTIPDSGSSTADTPDVSPAGKAFPGPPAAAGHPHPAAAPGGAGEPYGRRR